MAQGIKIMKCPGCGCTESKVIDSRPTEENSIRRRRECLSCQRRFTTFEMIETVPIIVIKKNGGKELFDKPKLLAGVLKATQKRCLFLIEIRRIFIKNEKYKQNFNNYVI